MHTWFNQLSKTGNREASRALLFCLSLSLITGHAGFIEDLRQERSQFSEEIVVKLGDRLSAAHSDYLDFLYDAVLHAQTLGQIINSDGATLHLQEDGEKRLIRILQPFVDRYSRYSSVWVFDPNMRAILTVQPTNSIAEQEVAAPRTLESVLRAKKNDIPEFGYVSQILPRSLTYAATDPRNPEFFVFLPIGFDTDGAKGFLALVADAGAFLQLHLKRLVLSDSISAVELTFDNVDRFWRFERDMWFLRSKLESESSSMSPEHGLRVLQFSQVQANRLGELVGAWSDIMSIYSDVDGGSHTKALFDLNPEVKIRVIIHEKEWQSLLDDNDRKIFWTTYSIHVFGALAIGVIASMLMLLLVFKREAARTKYQAALHRADTDHLTGTLSRQGFERLALSATTKSAWSSRAVCVIDIDHFKQVNDTYGHDIGDRVLAEVARVLNEQKRSEDFLTRWGGEEFLLLLAEVDSHSAYRSAERLRSAIETQRLHLDDGTILSVTVSVGVALVGEGGFNAAFMVADKALYRAKHRGRNQVQMSA